jgi:hypothetical protein
VFEVSDVVEAKNLLGPGKTGSVTSLGMPEREAPAGSEALAITTVHRKSNLSTTYKYFDARIAFSQPRLIVSRKRNRNLADLVNTWRKSLTTSAKTSDLYYDPDLKEAAFWQT